MSTVQEIGKTLDKLPRLERLKLHGDPPGPIGRKPEDLELQRAGLEKFFAGDTPEDAAYDRLQRGRQRGG
ncbi:MAG: hypothetical protein IAE97_08350 [Chthoniobacterales bacterium]|nr:hypothetical protein [Chthoniobacterales bacterium]